MVSVPIVDVIFPVLILTSTFNYAAESESVLCGRSWKHCSLEPWYYVTDPIIYPMVILNPRLCILNLNLNSLLVTRYEDDPIMIETF